jgi:hypothetical protein
MPAVRKGRAIRSCPLPGGHLASTTSEDDGPGDHRTTAEDRHLTQQLPFVVVGLWRGLLSVRRIVGGGWFTRDDPSSEISSRSSATLLHT